MNNYNPYIHHRRSIRMKGYDYSQTGLYYITVCCYDRQCLFGHIENKKMILNEYGKIACNEWLKSAQIRSEIELDCFVIMPNHIHGIIEINDIHPSHDRGDRPVASATTNPVALSYSIMDNVFLRDYIHTDDNIISDDDIRISEDIIRMGDDFCRGDRPVAQSNTPSVAQSVNPKGPTPKSIGAMMAGYKSAVTKQINIVRNTPKQPVWQRNYYDNIIRTEGAHRYIADYIVNNPSRWRDDKLNMQF